MWKNFFRISGGISMPPVEAPPRITMPRLIPRPMPAKSRFSRMFSVTTTSPRVRFRISRIAGAFSLPSLNSWAACATESGPFRVCRARKTFSRRGK